MIENYYCLSSYFPTECCRCDIKHSRAGGIHFKCCCQCSNNNYHPSYDGKNSLCKTCKEKDNKKNLSCNDPGWHKPNCPNKTTKKSDLIIVYCHHYEEKENKKADKKENSKKTLVKKSRNNLNSTFQ